jgi:hypothetical protein
MAELKVEMVQYLLQRCNLQDTIICTYTFHQARRSAISTFIVVSVNLNISVKLCSECRGP